MLLLNVNVLHTILILLPNEAQQLSINDIIKNVQEKQAVIQRRIDTKDERMQKRAERREKRQLRKAQEAAEKAVKIVVAVA